MFSLPLLRLSPYFIQNASTHCIINNFTFYKTIDTWILQSDSSELISRIHIKPVSEVHGGQPFWTRFIRWPTTVVVLFWLRFTAGIDIGTLISTRKAEVVFWGEMKTKLLKGLMQLMELNLIFYEISDMSAMYLKACDSVQLFCMLFGLRTKYTRGVFRHATRYSCFSSYASSSVTFLKRGKK